MEKQLEMPRMSCVVVVVDAVGGAGDGGGGGGEVGKARGE